MNYIFFIVILSFEHPSQISEQILSWELSADWIKKFIFSSSVLSISRFFFLQSCPIWYTSEWTDGAASTRKHAHIQEKWTCAGSKTNVLFTISPPNLFIVVNIVGGFKFIIMIWKAIRDIKAVNKTIKPKRTPNIMRSHPWHLSKQVTSLTSFCPRLLTNMS